MDRRLAWGVATAASITAGIPSCNGDGDDDGTSTHPGCEAFCDAAGAAECSDFDHRSCVAECIENQGGIDPACRDEANALLECAAGLPPSGFDCGENGPVLHEGSCGEEIMAAYVAGCAGDGLPGTGDGGTPTLPWECWLIDQAPDEPLCRCSNLSAPQPPEVVIEACPETLNCCLMQGDPAGAAECMCISMTDAECDAETASGLWTRVSSCPPQ